MIPSYSPIPATHEWRSSICSRSVVPLRGIPTMNAMPSTCGTRGLNQALPLASSCRCACTSACMSERLKTGAVFSWIYVASSHARRYSPAESSNSTASNPALRRMDISPGSRAIASNSATAPSRSSFARTRADMIRPRTSVSHMPPCSTKAFISARFPVRCRMSARKIVASSAFGALRAIKTRRRSMALSLRAR